MKLKETVQIAVSEYLQLKNRESNPDGSFDNAGRWYPSENEHQDCCSAIRSPSRAYPYSYMTHCRTLQHVCNRYNIDIEKAQKIVKEIQQEEKEKELKKITKVFKIVAVVGNSYRSIYDDSSWKLNVKRNGRKYYVYLNAKDAQERMDDNNFPNDSKNIGKSKAILKCNAYGKVKLAHCGYNKYYCLNVKPIQKV